VHEFSIAMNIVEIVEAEAAKADASSVKELVLDVGTMSGIEFSALDAALEMAVKNTILEKTEIRVNKIKAEARCTGCQETFEIQQIFDPCPSCGSLYHELLSGKELRVKSLVVDVDD
jgi:hydrogenase nickel incorporation protein HypA/HybF